MRIAVVSPFVDKQHGTERVVAELLERLASRNTVRVCLYARSVADIPTSSAENCPVNTDTSGGGTGKIIWRKVSAIRGPHLLQFLWWYFSNRFARWRDAKFRGVKTDLVYSPGINASDCDAITAHIVFHAFYEQVRSELRFPGHSPMHWPRTAHRILYYRLIMFLERRIYAKRGIALSAVSQLVADQLEQFFGRKDVLVVRNAVDTRAFNSRGRLARRVEARAKFAVAPGDFVFLLIGNDWKQKGLDALFEALTECTDLPVRLFVVGNDNRAPYVELCERLQLGSRVTFLNPSSDVMQFYAAADAYAGPSLRDAYALPVLEAMACGLPVIASTAAGVSEIIDDGNNGLLLKNPRDVKELAEQMRKIYGSSDLALSLGKAAERRAANESWDVHAEKMYAHFEEVLSRKKARSQTTATVPN